MNTPLSGLARSSCWMSLNPHPMSTPCTHSPPHVITHLATGVAVMTPQGEGEVAAAVHAHHNMCDGHQSGGSLPQADPQPLTYLEPQNGAKQCGQETSWMGVVNRVHSDSTASPSPPCILQEADLGLETANGRCCAPGGVAQ